MNRSPTALAAHDYAVRGWSVIPFVHAGKRPSIPWREFETRAPTLAEVDAWFDAQPDANVGMVTGAVSNLVVVDVDPAHGGTASLAALVRSHAPLPVTTEARSGGGGRHLYFAHPGGKVPNRKGLVPGIDVRGDGGCIVAPPSLHPNGRRYAWVPGRAPNDVPPAALPPWLLDLIRPGRPMPAA